MHSLRKQLIVYFTLISLVVLSLGSYFSYSHMLEIIKGQNEKYLFQQFRQLDYNMNSMISDVDRLSKLFLIDDAVQKFLETNLYSSEFDAIETTNSIIGRITSFISNYSYIQSIYIVTENRGQIGGSFKTTLVNTDDEWMEEYFQSEEYLKTRDVFPQVVIGGGKKESFFNPYISSIQDTSIISVMRGVKPIYDQRKSATLIININERYLASVYSAAFDDNEGETYIVDDRGGVVSSGDGRLIGTVSPYYEQIQVAGDFGSFVPTGSAMQVVYYKLQGENWYIVKEIPLQLFSEDILSMQKMIVFVFFISMLLIYTVSLAWLRKITKPLNKLADKMFDMSRGELGVTITKIPNNEFGIVIRRFNEMSLSIVDLLHKNNEIQEKKRKFEIEALQSQINPHFLYNTLNMIKWMASLMKANHIVASIVALGNLLRPAFKSTSPMCTLRDELRYLENYIKIINWRFSNSVNFILNVEEQFMDCQIPRFILQPLIENSITFGMQDHEHVINITIEAASLDDDVEILVTDTGKGIQPDKLAEINSNLQDVEDGVLRNKEGGIGIYNVNRRIRLHFGERYGIRIGNAEEKGTVVRILVPEVRDDGESIREEWPGGQN
ncbi:sensor histidine kinase [Paenibacillus yanchengensis]